MRLVLRLVPAIGLLLAASTLVLGGAGRGVTLDSYIEHVRFLASDELGGRGNGTDGLHKAGDYIAAQMKDSSPAGLQARGSSHSKSRRVSRQVPATF